MGIGNIVPGGFTRTTARKKKKRKRQILFNYRVAESRFCQMLIRRSKDRAAKIASYNLTAVYTSSYDSIAGETDRAPGIPLI